MVKRGAQREPKRFAEPTYTDPEMQKIAKQIIELRNRDVGGGVPMNDFFRDSFLLPAQLGDARRKTRGQEQILVSSYNEAWNDKKIKTFYGEGKVGDVSKMGAYHKETEEDRRLIREHPDIFKPGSYDDNDVNPARDLLGIHFDPKAIDIRLVRSLVRNLEHGGEKQWRLRQQDMEEAGIPEGIRALLTLDLLANEARMLMRGWLRENQRPDPSMPPDYLSADKAKEAYVKKLQSKIEPKGFPLAYLKGLEERLSDMVDERAQGLYKDQGEEIMNLWRAVNYLVSSKFSQGDVSEFRQSVYAAFKDRDVQKARQLIRPRILRNPDAFTPAAKHTLGITEDELKTARMERGDTKKMSADEKAAYEEKKRAVEEEKKLAPLKPFIGKVIFDKKNDRFILCLGLGKITRTRTTYDKQKHTYVEKSSDMPGMDVRYFSRPEKGAVAKARKENGIVKPGEFLASIQSGAYEIRDDIPLAKDATEISTTLFPRPTY